MLSLDDEDRRARRAPRLQVAVGLHGVLEVVALVYLHLDPARADVIEQFGGKRGLLGRIGAVVRERGARDV